MQDSQTRQKARSTIVYSSNDSSFLGDVVCAMGVFDGVHLGHRRLISDCIAKAKELGARSLILTFDVDPEEIFRNGSARKLMSNEDRISTLCSLGADIVYVQQFDEDFSKTPAVQFIETIMEGKMNPLGVYVGSNFRFGYKASGDVACLIDELSGKGCQVVGEDLLCEDGEPITATRIRDLVESGGLEDATEMLGRMHFMQADVRKGRQVGRTLGYPTANLVPSHDYVKLAEGVYSGYLLVHGDWYRASISVGVPKTFGDIKATIEAHLIDFDEDIYDKHVVVCFANYLRPMIKFDSTDALVEQITADTNAAAELPFPPDYDFPINAIVEKIK